MNIDIIERDGTTIAEVASDEVVVATEQDAVDLIGNASYQGASHVLLNEAHLASEFFDLACGLAGEVLQKFANYRMGLVVVGDFENVESRSLRAFVLESNRGDRVAFVATREAGIDRIASRRG